MTSGNIFTLLCLVIQHFVDFRYLLESFILIWTVIADMVTRFSGFVIGSIMTGVIWISQPESFVDVLLYDNLHVFLWFGGLFFALRGNRI